MNFYLVYYEWDFADCHTSGKFYGFNDFRARVVGSYNKEEIFWDNAKEHGWCCKSSKSSAELYQTLWQYMKKDGDKTRVTNVYIIDSFDDRPDTEQIEETLSEFRKEYEGTTTKALALRADKDSMMEDYSVLSLG